MILPDFILPSRVNQHWQYSGMDSPELCLDKTHFRSYPYKVDYVYNSRGYRDSEWPTELDELQNAIWCIGDSFTVGLGSPQEHTWPCQVGQKLNTRTINVSMDGASNHWIARKAVEIINKIKPALIIIQWSYLWRAELDNIDLPDEARRLSLTDNFCDDHYIGLEFFELVQQLELTKQNTNIIHSFIPDFGLSDTELNTIWNQLSGPDWPDWPTTMEEFSNLDSDVVNELINFFKIYDKLTVYYTLFKNTYNIIPEIRRLDLSRDGHHYDILTAEQFAISVGNLLSNRLI